MRMLALIAISIAGRLGCFAADPTMVDSVAVVVANKAITESRIDEEIRLAAFLNGESPQFNDGARRSAAGRLIERQLLQREIVVSAFTTNTTLAAGTLNDIRGRFLDEARFQAALTAAQITEPQLTSYLEEQARMLTFIDYRFRPEVAIDEQQARDFYAKEYPAFWMALHSGEPVPPFDEARDDIDRLLIDRLVDDEMERWLTTARAQTRIDYRDRTLRPELATTGANSR